jgi:DNA primase
MRFPSSFLDELRDRVSIVEVVRRKTALKSKGRGEFLGLCPFHKEKTPSFTVSGDKQFYHCFGCGAHGDVFKFVTDTEGVTFADAVERLADTAGIPLPKMSEEAVVKEQKRLSLYELLEQACQWFQAQLTGKEGVHAQQYLQHRKISGDTVNLFRLGYAPDQRNALKVALQAKGASEQDLLDTGLIIKNDKGEIYDRFRGRVIFPIADARGRIVAFGGRILGDGQPKYLNSPETSLFHKGMLLYNENLAREKAYKTNRLVIAEGYMDVIALHQGGVPVGVAPLGTALTEQQLQRIWRIVKEPVLCLDGDTAGQRAMERTALLALPLLQPGFGLRFTVLPEGKDPDDVLQTEGSAAMKQLLRDAAPLSETLWNMGLEKHPPQTPEAIAALGGELQKHAASIRDAQVREVFQQHFKQKLWELGKKKPNQQHSQAKSKANATYTGKGFTDEPLRYNDLSLPKSIDIYSVEGAEILLFLAIIYNPSLLSHEEVTETLIDLELSQAFLDKIRSAILEIRSLSTLKNVESVVNGLYKYGVRQELDALLKLKLAFFSEPSESEEKAKQAWDYTVLLYRKALIEKECHQLEGLFSLEAEQQARYLREELQTIEKEKRDFEYAFGETS